MLNDVQSKFRELRLKHCSENIETLLAQAKEKNLSTLQVIDRLLAIEIEQRHSAKKSGYSGSQNYWNSQPLISLTSLFMFHVKNRKLSS